MAGNKKKEIISIAQENLHMLKRLTEKTSCYNFQQWEKEYDRAQYYKRSHCVYPSIDFYKTQRAETFGNKFYNPNKNGFCISKTNYGSFRNKKKFEDFNYKEFEALSNKNNSHAKTMEVEKNEEKKETKKIEEDNKNNETKNIEENEENKETKKIEENKENNENKKIEENKENNENKRIEENKEHDENKKIEENKEHDENKKIEEDKEKNENKKTFPHYQ